MSDGTRHRNCTPLLIMLFSFASLLLLLILLPWWSQWQKDREQAAVISARIARYRALLDSRSRLEAGLKEIDTRLKQSGYFMEATSPEVAAAELQNRVKAVVTRAGGTLVSSEVLNAEKEPGWVGVKVRMTGDDDALSRTLLALRRTRPVVLVEALTVRGQVRYRRQGDRMVPQSAPPLDIGFQVVGRTWRKSP